MTTMYNNTVINDSTRLQTNLLCIVTIFLPENPLFFLTILFYPGIHYSSIFRSKVSIWHLNFSLLLNSCWPVWSYNSSVPTFRERRNNGVCPFLTTTPRVFFLWSTETSSRSDAMMETCEKTFLEWGWKKIGHAPAPDPA